VKLTVTGGTICHLVCHCADCRRFTGSVNYGVLVKNGQVEIEGERNIFNLTKSRGNEGGWDRNSCVSAAVASRPRLLTAPPTTGAPAGAGGWCHLRHG
jgi:hypothetical protein